MVQTEALLWNPGMVWAEGLESQVEDAQSLLGNTGEPPGKSDGEKNLRQHG